MAITHTEVRRHPRWREEQNMPLPTPAAPTHRVRLLGIVAILIIGTALGVVIFRG
jgi:hypothetical protein